MPSVDLGQQRLGVSVNVFEDAITTSLESIGVPD